ncbi:MAG: HAMP domain-containing protein [Deltaproteobacteria bacterium]|nr:HAMP domain-containing protein [Deltaproteobacteria bacterium]
MRFKLKYKLFLMILSISIVMVTGMFFISKITFRYQFSNYLEHRELKRVNAISKSIAQYFPEEDDIQFLIDDPEIFFMLERPFFKLFRKRVRDRKKDGDRRPREFGPGGRDKRDRHMDKRPPGGKKRPPIILMDKNGAVVLGRLRDRDDLKKVPLIINNKRVGYLGFYPGHNIRMEDEQRFLYNQYRTFFIISVGMILLSVIVGIWASYFLEKPIKIIADGAKELTKGNFNIKIPEKSGDELGDLARDFNILSKTLSENEEDRKKWAADIAHELRTPLTLLSGELEAMEDGVRPLTSKTVKLMQEDIRHLIRLVNDLNELSRTDIGSMNYKMDSIDPVKILKRSVDKFRDRIELSELSLSLNTIESTKIFGDTERLSQLFGNIIKNSIDYTDSKGSINISAIDKDRNIIITFEDSKPGVPEETLTKLFDRLYRVESSRNRDFGGSGLGLAICKNIVSAHDGNIKALKSLKGGLSVVIKLPLLK